MKCLVLFFFIIIIIKPTKGQQILYPDSLNYLLTNKFYLDYNLPEKRKILSFENKHFIAKLNPIKYLSAGILFFIKGVFPKKFRRIVCTKEIINFQFFLFLPYICLFNSFTCFVKVILCIKYCFFAYLAFWKALEKQPAQPEKITKNIF